MSTWIEPSRQDWINEAPDSRIYGTREVMERRRDNYATIVTVAMQQAIPEVAGFYAIGLAHWGLALMELSEQEVAA